MSFAMTQRNLQLSDQDYERFRSLISDRSGLFFPDKRRQDLKRGLLRAFSDEEHKSLEDYYRLLSRSPTGGEAWEQLIGQITIGETHFFRNHPQFEALRKHILPKIIRRKRSLGQHLRIWSAGCATGEEPYSLAILLHELLPDLSAWNITILATDINREALSLARQGRYGDWSFREKGVERLRNRYFSRQEKKWQVAHRVQDLVSFVYFNLVEDPYPSLANNTVAFDLILCRNVTIYFTSEVTQGVVNRLYEALVEDGWLVVGHSEPSPIIYTKFEPRNFPGAVLYQKTDHPARVDFSWLDAVAQPTEAVPLMPPVRSIVAQPPAAAVPLVPPTQPVIRQTPSPPVQPEPQASPPAPLDLCTQVEALLQQDKVEEALEQLQHVLGHGRDCAQAYLLLGKFRADSGHWEEARHWCEQAVEHDPLLTEAHFLLALVHSQEDHFEQALVSMKRVVYLERKAVLGHFWLANLYRELGDAAHTSKSLENTIRLLRALPEDAAIPWSDGMTAGRLLHTVRQQFDERSM